MLMKYVSAGETRLHFSAFFILRYSYMTNLRTKDYPELKYIASRSSPLKKKNPPSNFHALSSPNCKPEADNPSEASASLRIRDKTWKESNCLDDQLQGSAQLKIFTLYFIWETYCIKPLKFRSLKILTLSPSTIVYPT